MYVESTVITGILFLVALSFAASKRKQFALAVIPLILVPAFHLLGYPLSPWIAGLLDTAVWRIYILIDVVGLILSCILLALLSFRIKATRNRALFLVATCTFNVILAMIFIFDLINKI